MRTSVIALGLLTLGLAHCSGDKALFVGEERDGGGASAGDTGSGGSGSGTTGGDAGTQNGGGSQGGTSNGGSTNGGTGTAAEGGEGAQPGTGGTEQGGTDAGGSSGDAGSGTTGGSGGSRTGGTGGSGMAGRAGASNAGAGGSSDNDCTEMAREYQERLATAQQCAIASTGNTECALEMPNDLLCGCPTFVTTRYESEIRRMNELIEKAVSCSRICPTIVCREVNRGVCARDPNIVSGRLRCTAEP